MSGERDLALEAQVRTAIAEREAQRGGPGARELVGAVMTTFGDGERAITTLRRLRAEVAQVVVVDLGSEDDTEERLRAAFPEQELVILPTEAGFGAALNEGARRLAQPFILSLHGDARPRPEAVARLLAAVVDDRERVACAGPRLFAADGHQEASAGYRSSPVTLIHQRLSALFPKAGAKRFRRPARFAPTRRLDVDWVSGAVCLFRRDALEQVGGADEGFFLAYGDVELCLRLRAAGWRVAFEGRARAIHFDTVAEARASVSAARRRLRALARRD